VAPAIALVPFRSIPKQARRSNDVDPAWHLELREQTRLEAR